MSTWIKFTHADAAAQLSPDGTRVTAAKYNGRTVTPAELAHNFCRTDAELVILVKAMRDEAGRTRGGRW